MADMKNLRRTPLLFETASYRRPDDSSAQPKRPNVDPSQRPGHTGVGARFLQQKRPPEDRDIRRFQRRVRFKPEEFKKTQEREVRVDRRAREAIRQFPKKERTIDNPAVAKEVDRQRFMTNQRRRQAQTISRSLSFADTPDLGPYTAPMRQADKSDFPRGLGSAEHRTMMNKVLHYVRRSGKAFGGSHDANMDDTYGRTGISFGGNRDMSDAYHDHLQQNLPPIIAAAIRRENFAHDNNKGDANHSHEVTHSELWDAVQAHFAHQKRKAGRRRRAR